MLILTLVWIAALVVTVSGCLFPMASSSLIIMDHAVLCWWVNTRRRFFSPILVWSFSRSLAALTLSSRSLKLTMNLMALFWIISMSCTLHLADEPRITSVYFKIGLQRLVYATSLASWGALCRRCLIPPSILLDLIDFSAIWRSNVRSDWIVTHRYFVFSAQARHVVPSLYWTTGVTLPSL